MAKKKACYVTLHIFEFNPYRNDREWFHEELREGLFLAWVLTMLNIMFSRRDRIRSTREIILSQSLMLGSDYTNLSIPPVLCHGYLTDLIG